MNVQYNIESTDIEIPVIRDVDVMRPVFGGIQIIGSVHGIMGNMGKYDHNHDVVIARFKVKGRFLCFVNTSVKAPVYKHSMVLP